MELCGIWERALGQEGRLGPPVCSRLFFTKIGAPLCGMSSINPSGLRPLPQRSSRSSRGRTSKQSPSHVAGVMISAQSRESYSRAGKCCAWKAPWAMPRERIARQIKGGPARWRGQNEERDSHAQKAFVQHVFDQSVYRCRVTCFTREKRIT